MSSERSKSDRRADGERDVEAELGDRHPERAIDVRERPQEQDRERRRHARSHRAHQVAADREALEQTREEVAADSEVDADRDRHPRRVAVEPEGDHQRRRDDGEDPELHEARHGQRAVVADRREEDHPVERHLAHGDREPEHLQEHLRLAPPLAEHEADQVGCEQGQTDPERERPHQRQPVGLLERLEQQRGAILDGADGRVDRPAGSASRAGRRTSRRWSRARARRARRGRR